MRRALVALFVSLFVALSTVAGAGRAQAFVQRMNGTSGVRWNKSCAPVTIYLNGFDASPNTHLLTVPGIIKSVTAAAHTWSSDVVTCPSGEAPFFEIVPSVAPLDAAPAPAAYDAKNSIIFRTDHWGSSGRSGPDFDYDPSALAFTGVTSAPDGHILDVDIEINATDEAGLWMKWMNLDPGVEVPASSSGQITDTIEYFDLQTVLTHELGHFIGLNHTCFRPEKGQPAVNDDRGQPIPSCTAASSDVENTVMFDETDPGQTVKRKLTADDIRGVCTIYAPSQVHEACVLDNPPPGCAVAPPRRGRRVLPLVALAGLGSLVALARRRRRGVSDRARARA